MKNLFILFFTLALACRVSATVYYFSSSGGYYSNAITSTQAANPNTPYRSISTLDSILKGTFTKLVAKPGDQFLLKRGDVFFGTLTISINGAAGSPYVLGSYGTGPKPVITALQRLTFPSAAVNNIYTSAAINPQSKPYILILNDSLQPIGRWPNASAPNNGYFKIDNVVDDSNRTWTEITDNEWGTYTNKPDDVFAGGQIAFRMNRFTFTTQEIGTEKRNGNAITFHLPFLQSSGKYGYFIQNHIKTLDSTGEWCYNANNTASIYGTPPTTNKIEMPVYDDILKANGDFWNIRDIDFVGCNRYGVNVAGDNILLEGCFIKYAGKSGVLTNSSNTVVRFDTVYKANHYGMQIRGSGNNTIATHNFISTINPYLGMGPGGNTGGSGFDVVGNDKTISLNYIYNTAYASVNANEGSRQHIDSNIFDRANQRIDDGGGFYTVNQKQGSTLPRVGYTGKRLTYNIIKNIENCAGCTDPRVGTFETSNQTYLIYLDQYSNRWTVKGNIGLGGYMGFFSNDPFNDTLTDNFFSNIRSVNMRLRGNHTDAGYPVVNNVVKNNVYFSALNATSQVMYANAVISGTTVGTWGKFDANYFVAPYVTPNGMYFSDGASTAPLTWDNWKTKYSYELTSHKAPMNLAAATQAPAVYTKLLVNETVKDSTFDLGGFTWLTAQGDSLNNNKVTLHGISALGLIRTGVYTGTVINKPPTASVTGPVNNSVFTAPASITLQATATDTDGTIIKIEFYYGGTNLIGTTTGTTYPWTNVPAGNYAITAKAYDNSGAVTTSAVNTIIVSNPTTPTGTRRIAVSCDGNIHDVDDICSVSMELGMIAKSNLQSQITYFGYSDHYWTTTASQQTNEANSVINSANSWGGFDMSKFIDVQKNHATAVAMLTAEINKSTATDSLIIAGLGPMQVIGEAIAASDATKRKYVRVVSHSDWNNIHAGNVGASEGLSLPRYNLDPTNNTGSGTTFISSMGVNLTKIKDQNATVSAPYTSYTWLQTSADTRLNLMWNECRNVANKSNFDCSDAGVIWYILKNDDSGSPSKLQAFFEATTTPGTPGSFKVRTRYRKIKIN